MTGSRGGLRQATLFLIAALVIVMAVRWLVGNADVDALIGDGPSPSAAGEKLVVYCAHDAVYAEAILDAFEKESGIPLDIKFDTEATKSLGLVELIARERNNPRCDVFWNNEQLGTMRLADDDLLLPYQGPGWERTPDAYKDPGGNWVGFAARMRVWIVNTDYLDATHAAVETALEAEDLARVAVAKPLFGTTRTHYTVLWDHLGGEATVAWHDEWRKRGVLELNGNGPVADTVARGAVHLGLTDTDDHFSRKDRGAPVAMVPFKLDDGRAIVIPNTAAIIRGTKRTEQAQQLVDYLTSFETQLKLAQSTSRQLPLITPVGVEYTLPPDVEPLMRYIDTGYPLHQLDTARAACLDWLRERYTR